MPPPAPLPCGATTRARYDSSRRRWRHLDFGACQVWLEADIHRVDCRGSGGSLSSRSRRPTDQSQGID